MQKKELTYEDAMKDKEYRYFYILLKTDYEARLNPEYAIIKYFAEVYHTTNLCDMGQNGIPRYQNVQRKMYRVKSVFHCCQPTEEDKKMLEAKQETYKEINRDTVVKVMTTQTALF